jgi:hypothetical protein
MSNLEIFIPAPCGLDSNYGLGKRDEANRARHNRADRQAESDVIELLCRAVLAEDFAYPGMVAGRMSGLYCGP